MGKYKVDFVYTGVFFLMVLSSVVVVYALGSSQRVNALVAIMSAVVVGTVFLLRYLGKGGIIGFFFLGTVLFKMFGIGYLAVFEAELKRDLVLFFVIFWGYLILEASYIVACIRRQDKYHVKKDK
ncbi:hypothetical protein [Bergeyella sp. RCAD1439]|uniref:hypothetical protein n=1 Tax=Bergeyella anatis TaxID=3113737 RepID=UPI002E199C7B|nr:hypothetical protein [Bergeyella sp. RCAD1439]